jgi:hypothetical protein
VRLLMLALLKSLPGASLFMPAARAPLTFAPEGPVDFPAPPDP